MKKILFALFCLSVSLCYADEPANIKIRKTDANIVGDVKDKNTKEHIPYATISIQGTTIGTVTDNTGHYFLKNLPVGDFTITVNCLGYKPISKKVKTIKGKTLIIDFIIEEDFVALDGVVVSANRSETKRRLAPTLVNVVSLKTFEQTNSCNLSQGLNFQPGVRVEDNCQNCGFSQVRINGLEGRYTQILIDSRAIFSSLSGVYGLEHIPTNMIDRVEVMRGGGSALFGSSAIAGTINVITKEPLRNSGSLSHTTTNFNGSGTYEHNTALNLSLVTEDHKAGVYVYAQDRYRSAYDHTDDGFSELPRLKMQTLGTRGYFKTSDYSKLSFEYHHIEEFRRGGNDQDLPAHMAVNKDLNTVGVDGIVEQIRHSINSGGLTFDYFAPDQKNHLSLYASAQHIDRDSYYNGYGKTTNTTLVGGAKYIHNFDNLWFMPSDLTLGAEYNYDDLKDRSLEPAKEIQENLPPIHQKCRIVSGYAQNEWKTEKWSILLGARLDKHNKINHVIVSPRANLRYNLTKNLNFRLSYAEGFRAPQAFDEDLHIGNVGKDLKVIKLSKDLKEERSQSFNASIDMYQRFGDFQANLLLEGFYTKLTDAFTTRVIDQKNLGNEYNFYVEERINGDGAKVYGTTLEGNIAYKKLFQLQAGLTLQKSLYDSPEEWSGNSGSKAGKARYSTKMLRTPNTYGYFTATYTPIKPLSIALSGTYTGHMYIPHVWSEVLGSDASGKPIRDDELIKSPTFFEMNCKVAYDFDLSHCLCLELSAGVKNIFNAYQDDFDQGGSRDSGYVYGPGAPRSFFVGAKISY